MLSLLSFISKFSYFVSSFHVISKSLGKLTSAELGLIPSIYKSKVYLQQSKSFIFLCGVDLDSVSFNQILDDSFIVFQGSFFTTSLNSFVDLIFPVPVYTEHFVTYVI